MLVGMVWLACKDLGLLVPGSLVAGQQLPTVQLSIMLSMLPWGTSV
jgi:hypothetical protein